MKYKAIGDDLFFARYRRFLCVEGVDFVVGGDEHPPEPALEPNRDQLIYEIKSKVREQAKELGIDLKSELPEIKQEKHESNYDKDGRFIISKANEIDREISLEYINKYPDELDGFTYELMKATVGEKNMTFEGPEPKPYVQKSNTLRNDNKFEFDRDMD